MKDFVTRNVAAVTLGLGVVLLASIIVNIGVLARIGPLESRVDQNAADLARVEIGAGLFASEVTGLQEQLSRLAPGVGRGLTEAVSGLQAFRSSTLEFEVSINETIPIETEILLDRTLTVPIQASFPIDQVVETTITIAGPFDTKIPLDVSVPVQLDIPVDLEIPLSINETIPISTSVPVRLTVPIAIEVAETELASLADALGSGLAAFADLMAGFE
ncbi:MAG: hypothetical protein RI637_01065 [Acidimicrobiia bacterium]|nr:hypothetical protein [Acidimicrobiia bacterium]